VQERRCAYLAFHKAVGSAWPESSRFKTVRSWCGEEERWCMDTLTVINGGTFALRHSVRLKPKKETGQHAADRLFEEFSVKTQKTQTSSTSNQGMVIKTWHRTGFLVLLDPKIP
jgi:hypothetical protein